MQVMPMPMPGVDAKIAEHEAAAHEKRNWVRLTFDCNNHCVFCLDTLSHDGQMRDPDDVKRQILDGARKGATRLILSGGEPTMHPRYVDFIRLGKLARYTKIQTVTNGRMFAYDPFLQKCLNAGLDEITFSVHGPNARIHDALVGVKGAFEQEVQGIRNALADGRPIINIDVVINRANVKHLRELLEKFIAMGVREYDLLHVIPFGNAFREGKDTLFYDLEAMRPYLLQAFEFSKRPDIHIWLNRFPIQHLEGYEHLIQDPYKLNDEVKGRQEEFHRLLTEGIDLDCRDPARCKLCYLERVCDTLYDVRDRVAQRAFDIVRVDTGWEARQGPRWGGDPASSKRARLLAEEASEIVSPVVSPETPVPARVHLPLAMASSAPIPAIPQHTAETLAASANATGLWICAPDLVSALTVLPRYLGVREIELELDDYTGLAAALGSGDALAGRRLVRTRASTVAQATQLLSIPGDFGVVVALTKATAPWLKAIDPVPLRLALYQPTHERMTESLHHDVDLRAFFAEFTQTVPVEGIPACVTGRPAPPRPRVLDTAMMAPEGGLEIFRYAQRYIHAHYKARSLRCKPCVHYESCDGMHINYIRAHGYGVMLPVLADAE